MRGSQLAVALAGLIGLSACDSLFGLDRSYESDASIDAPAGQRVIVSIKVLPPQPHPGQQVSVTVKFHHTPMEELAFELTATDGMLDSVPPSVTLDELGIGEVTVGYTAPGVVGPITLTAKAAGERLDLVVMVAGSRIVGADHAGTATITMARGSTLGTKITLANPDAINAIGVWMTTAGAHAKAALYTDASGLSGPGTLVFSSTEAMVATGRNILPGSTAPVAATSYWILVMFDGYAVVAADAPDNGYVFQSQTYENGFPASYPLAFFAATSGPQPMMFVSLGL